MEGQSKVEDQCVEKEEGDGVHVQVTGGGDACRDRRCEQNRTKVDSRSGKSGAEHVESSGSGNERPSEQSQAKVDECVEKISGVHAKDTGSGTENRDGE